MAPTAFLPWSEGRTWMGRSCLRPDGCLPTLGVRQVLGQLAFCGIVCQNRNASLFIFRKLACIFLVSVAGDHRRPHYICIYIYLYLYLYLYLFATFPSTGSLHRNHGGQGDAIDAWGSDHDWPWLPSGSDASSDSGRCASCSFHRWCKVMPHEHGKMGHLLKMVALPFRPGIEH